jgi:hypothetical protein
VRDVENEYLAVEKDSVVLQAQQWATAGAASTEPISEAAAWTIVGTGARQPVPTRTHASTQPPRPLFARGHTCMRDLTTVRGRPGGDCARACPVLLL